MYWRRSNRLPWELPRRFVIQSPITIVFTSCFIQWSITIQNLFCKLYLESFSFVDEATFSKMGDMIDNPELAKEFPVIAYINKLRENKTEEEKENGNKHLVALLTECGFEKMLALLGKGQQCRNLSFLINIVF